MKTYSEAIKLASVLRKYGDILGFAAVVNGLTHHSGASLFLPDHSSILSLTHISLLLLFLMVLL